MLARKHWQRFGKLRNYYNNWTAMGLELEGKSTAERKRGPQRTSGILVCVICVVKCGKKSTQVFFRRNNQLWNIRLNFLCFMYEFLWGQNTVNKRLKTIIQVKSKHNCFTLNYSSCNCLKFQTLTSAIRNILISHSQTMLLEFWD